MTNNPMGRVEMEQIGALRFGIAWKGQLAAALSVDRKTVSRWLRDDIVAPWAAEKIRAMGSIAPPPLDAGDRAAACADAIEPDLARLIDLAGAAGWTRAEVKTAMGSLIAADPA